MHSKISISLGSGAGVDGSPAAPGELVLELARAADAADPFRFRFVEQSYLLRQPGGAYTSAVFPWSAAVLDDLSALQQVRPDAMARQRLGERLRAFLAQAGWGALEQELAAALRRDRRVHITVRSSAAEMYALPWELLSLRATGQHLGELDRCLIRYEWPGTRTAACVPDPPHEGGRVLVAWSAAGGPVPAAEHVAAVRRACRQGHHRFGGQDVLAHVSLNALREALDAAPVAVLHILCHGAELDGSGDGYGLLWNGPDADTSREIVDAGALRQVLAPHAGTLRLVVLSACHGSSAGRPGNHLGSVAQALHRIGIQAVVASRAPLSVQGSIALTETLYERLLVGLCSLEDAFVAARQRLWHRGDTLDWAALQLYARAADGPAHRPVTFRPYRGLAAFTAADRRFFFGRDAEAEALIAALQGGQRLLAVVGASGSGKSSLVLAGVVPRVQEGALGPDPVAVRVMRPGARPCEELDDALAARDPGARLLLVVDQLEELFTQVQDRAEIDAFVTRLLAAVDSPDGAVTVVLTLRADFLGKCLALDRGLAERLNTCMHLVLPMGEADLRVAIVAPAARVGLRVDPAVVDALLSELRVDPAQESVGEVGAGAGNLPLLSFVLDALWERRDSGRITWAGWDAIGGLRGAIAQRADEVLAGCTSDEQRRLVRDLFSRLVQLGQDTGDTRRYVALAELKSVAPGRARAELQRWIDARLLAADEDEVWVAHEAVIREWRTLRRWLDEDREALLVQQELRHAAQRWAAQGRCPDALWRGERLRRVQALCKAGRLSATETLFVDASAAARRAEDDAAEAQRRRVLALAHQTRRQSRTLALGAVAVAVVLTGLGLWTRSLQYIAETQGSKVRDAALVAAARDLLARDEPAWARNLLLEVQRPDQASEWLSVAWEALGDDLPTRMLDGGEGELSAVSFSPDGQRVLGASSNGTAWVWHADMSAAPVVLAGHTAGIHAAQFSPDGQQVITASQDGTARVWRADGSGAPVVLEGHDGAVALAAFSPDGQHVVTASQDRTARVWRADGSGAPVVLAGHQAHVMFAAFSPDGQRVVTASQDRTARVWRADGSGAPAVLEGHEGAVRRAAFSPDGRRVVTASDDGTARVWHLDGREAPVVLAGHEHRQGYGGRVLTAMFSPDGQSALTTGDDGTARVWPTRGGPAVVLAGHNGRVWSAAFSPDGSRVVSGAEDGTARVWRADGLGVLLVLPRPGRTHAAATVRVSFSPDGKRVVTTYGHWARTWALDVPTLTQHLRESDRACLPADLRQNVLGESDDEARTGYEACQREQALAISKERPSSASLE